LDYERRRARSVKPQTMKSLQDQQCPTAQMRGDCSTWRRSSILLALDFDQGRLKALEISKKSNRKSVVQLLSGTHRLESQTEKWLKKALHACETYSCEEGEIGDKVHFLFSCESHAAHLTGITRQASGPWRPRVGHGHAGVSASARIISETAEDRAVGSWQETSKSTDQPPKATSKPPD